MYEIRLTTTQNETYIHPIYNITYDRDDIDKAIKLACKNFMCPVNAIRKIVIIEKVIK